MEHWMILAIVAGVFAGLYHVLTKLAAGKIPDVTAAFWLEVGAIVVLAAYLVAIRQQPWGPAVTRAGLAYALLGGVCVAVAGVLGFVMYRQGLLSVAAPVFILASLFIPVLVGIVFLKEPVSVPRIVGMAFAAVSVWLLLR